MVYERAGKPAQERDLINLDKVIGSYYDLVPDVSIREQRVEFGTSGHRGSSLNTAFNEAHIVAITQAIVEYRTSRGIDGPLFIGFDTHALSMPAFRSAIEVLVAAGVETSVDARMSWTPTPSVSHAILRANTDASGAVRGDAIAGGSQTGAKTGLADGIVVTPSHNPPSDGGFKYNPPNGGPADTNVTSWIADRANEILKSGFKSVKRVPYEQAIHSDYIHKYDFMKHYVDDLKNVIDVDVIKGAGIKIGADPLGGASVDYWGALGEQYGLNLTVLNEKVDPRWSFMTLDWDGKIRMDCSSPYAMASLVHKMTGGELDIDIATGNDADSDRHGVVTKDAGLMNPNNYLAVAIGYLFGGNRPAWGKDIRVGKTIVSSRLINLVVKKLGKNILEVPVGFKWFVDGLIDSSIGFGGEESAGASFLKKDARVWTTDKDGLLLALLASEITAKTGKTPSELHKELVQEFGASYYERIDSPATPDEKAILKALSPEAVTSTELAGEKIEHIYTNAPGNNAPIGGLYIGTQNAWFAARPSGTENVYKIYAESFVSSEHLKRVQDEARIVVAGALAS
jgi:phosphoglucomutase